MIVIYVVKHDLAMRMLKARVATLSASDSHVISLPPTAY